MLKTGISAIDGAKNNCIVGVDEVGRGSWAGPAVVCAVAAFCEWSDPEVKDSKKMSRKARERVYEKYWSDERLVISLCVIPVEDIDRHGVHRAILDGHRQAIEGTFYRLVYPPIIVVDGTDAPEMPDAYALPKADNLVPAVSLASVIAKVFRDRLMVGLDKDFPGYGLDKSSGYGTLQHREALQRLGPSPIHRRSFAPIAALIQQREQSDILDIIEEIDRQGDP